MVPAEQSGQTRERPVQSSGTKKARIFLNLLPKDVGYGSSGSSGTATPTEYGGHLRTLQLNEELAASFTRQVSTAEREYSASEEESSYEDGFSDDSDSIGLATSPLLDLVRSESPSPATLKESSQLQAAQREITVDAQQSPDLLVVDERQNNSDPGPQRSDVNPPSAVVSHSTSECTREEAREEEEEEEEEKDEEKGKNEGNSSENNPGPAAVEEEYRSLLCYEKINHSTFGSMDKLEFSNALSIPEFFPSTKSDPFCECWATEQNNYEDIFPYHDSYEAIPPRLLLLQSSVLSRDTLVLPPLPFLPTTKLDISILPLESMKENETSDSNGQNAMLELAGILLFPSEDGSNEREVMDGLLPQVVTMQ